MNQLSVKNSLIVIFTSIRALSGDIIFIVTKSKLFLNLFRPPISFNLKYLKQFCIGRSKRKSANWKLHVQFGENLMSKDAIN